MTPDRTDTRALISRLNGWRDDRVQGTPLRSGPAQVMADAAHALTDLAARLEEAERGRAVCVDVDVRIEELNKTISDLEAKVRAGDALAEAVDREHLAGLLARNVGAPSYHNGMLGECQNYACGALAGRNAGAQEKSGERIEGLPSS